MGRRYAITVGIDDYPGTASDLAGCVNDADDWSDFLGVRGYTVERLRNAQATKPAIRRSLNRPLPQLKWGDRLVFVFSGHGSWVPDTDGDEADQRDEVLVCHDFASGGLFTDDELHRLFSQRPYGARVMVIADSCHSGGVHRAFGPEQGEAVRFLPPDNFLDGPALARAEQVEMRPAGGVPRHPALLMSACADSELAYETTFGGRRNGVFTHHALRSWQPGMGWREWHKAIGEQVVAGNWRQTPQLVGSWWQRAMWKTVT